MLKQHMLKLVVGLALTATLLSGFALSGVSAVAKVAPAQHQLACGGGVGTPCGG
ncbi:MAG TPA: hypothetical protein VKT82_26265 [Ktedonobacterales bacterium]|nr:hypothetical protein [Ktedonobacterales bacterium]